MTMLAPLALRAAVIAALSDAPAIAGGRVFEKRSKALGMNVPSALYVRWSDSTIDAGEINGAANDFETALVIEAYGRRNADASADDNASGALVDAHNRLMADPSLGGIFDDSVEIGQDPTLSYDDDLEDEALVCIVAHYTVRHRTRGASLT